MGLMAALAVSGNAAEVVSMKLCAEKDYDMAKRECAAGKALEGSGIMIPPDGKVNVLTAIKTSQGEEIYHVWIFGGKATIGTITVYDSTTKTMRPADQTDLDWLKERKIEGARLVVKLSVPSASNYRTRSQKTLGAGAAGPWKVQVFDSTGLTPVGEIGFTVTPKETGITEN
jgi:hypothetical protein